MAAKKRQKVNERLEAGLKANERLHCFMSFPYVSHIFMQHVVFSRETYCDFTWFYNISHISHTLGLSDIGPVFGTIRKNCAVTHYTKCTGHSFFPFIITISIFRVYPFFLEGTTHIFIPSSPAQGLQHGWILRWKKKGWNPNHPIFFSWNMFAICLNMFKQCRHLWLFLDVSRCF